MIHTIIFDVGGTLVNAPDIFEVIANGDINIKKKIIEKFQYLYSGRKFYTIKEILQRVTNDLSMNIKADEMYIDIFTNKSHLFDETFETLKLLKDKTKLIIASDADSDVLIPELKKLDIYKYFNKILVSSDIKAYKNSDKFVKKIIPLLYHPYNKILFVGDSSVDMEIAKKIGVKSVYIKRTEKKFESDYVITNLKELINLI